MRNLLTWGFPIVGFVLLLWGSLFLFYPTKIAGIDALTVLFQAENPIVQMTVLDLRLPRALTGTLLGACLAVAGALLQTITRNPLASPSLLSVNSGASFAMVLATAIAPTFFSNYSIALVASVGGGLSWFLVMLISGGWHSNSDRSRVILAGIAVSLFCAALTKLTIILAEDQAVSIMSWLAGGIANARWTEFAIMLPVFVLTLLFCLFFASRLNLLNLSDESAQTLGIDLFKVRWYCNVMALVIVGAAVSVAGPIAFIGLLVPHLARYWVGYDLRKSLPMSMLLGACLLLLADILARAVNFPNEVPAGALLALVGAPVFVWFARGKR